MNIDDLFHLTGKSVVVAGGGGSIGSSIVQLFTQVGADVFVLDQNIDNVKGISGASASTIDLRDTQALSRVVDEIGSNNGIDILVHSAGINPAVPISNVTEEDWENVISVNLKSCLFLVKAGYPYLKKRGGSIVLISSITSLTGFAGLSLYGTSKGGINSLVKNLACELAKDNIRINGVAPGTVKTPMTKDFCWGNEMKLNAHEATIPANRIAEPDDVARSVVYFASDMSEYITGQVLYVDGGMSAMQADYIDLELRNK